MPPSRPHIPALGPSQLVLRRGVSPWGTAGFPELCQSPSLLFVPFATYSDPNSSLGVEIRRENELQGRGVAEEGEGFGVWGSEEAVGQGSCGWGRPSLEGPWEDADRRKASSFSL